MNKENYIIVSILAIALIGLGIYSSMNYKYEEKNDEKPKIQDTFKEISTEEQNEQSPSQTHPDNNTVVNDESEITTNETPSNEQTDSSLSNEKGVIKITYAEFKEKVANKEDFVLAVVSASCGACTTYKPTLEETANSNNIIIYTIDIIEMTQTDKTELLTTYDIHSTPTTLVFLDGIEQAKKTIIGNISKETLEKELAKYKII